MDEVIVVSTAGEDDFSDLGEAKPAFNNLKYDHPDFPMITRDDLPV